MTSLPTPAFALRSHTEGPRHVRLSVTGELDYETADELLAEARGLLAGHPELTTLRLDFASLDSCDSMGLSALLMVHRECTAARVRLHLDERPPAFERLLRVTGTLAHLTGEEPDPPPG
ncbi:MULTISPECIES: STAS domain-containing protein [Streptomyces]|uniref:STAS domain-containing protein n=1 Tax=Streptomyces albus (strain ATCC 21838 / DSM 41398 / FERM P-419 / JCM 4703 / NBRC 107858) TaxID=1081613 RepID=A0A0B5EMN9_STRA4|nr:STAS domain-containing protein [Streptomyces sp. SCSIO ZS0520]AJE83758.1 hypothetical protein SLNWT_3382 [Streptomyces albus]AOU78064.1 hypothetical protein SLNHY_3373 [Streptomyces albus]AYN33818.1 anti-sigma factor antagonist [Streptomyces albus]